MSDAFKPLLSRLANGHTLSAEEAGEFFAACLRGEPTSSQVAAAITAMRLRGETVEEISACAAAMRAAAVLLKHPHQTIDVCGTGGDGLHTLNVSTAAGFVVAAGGLKVAKHGNRALSSRSGAADVLAALGVEVSPGLGRQRKALDEAGICFLFAPAHHGAMRHVTPIRAEIGFRTVFNLLGPLANPAGAQRQLLGVYDPRWLDPLARVLGALGTKRAWTAHGEGMDEITVTGPTEICEWRDGSVRRFTITPQDAGLSIHPLRDLTGGSPDENAAALRAVFSGRLGAYRDIVLLNAAAAFVIGERAETLRDGADLAARLIDDGAAMTVLDKLVAITNGPEPGDA